MDDSNTGYGEINVSRGHFRSALNGLSKQLDAALLAAEEWKAVAGTRLEYIIALDQRIGKTIEAASKVPSLFGVDSSDNIFPCAELGKSSAREAFMMAKLKLESLEFFSARLTFEAMEVQNTLQRTLELCYKAKEVQRPTCDQVFNQADTEDESDNKSPLDTVYEHYENESEELMRGNGHLSLTTSSDLACTLARLRAE